MPNNTWVGGRQEKGRVEGFNLASHFEESIGWTIKRLFPSDQIEKGEEAELDPLYTHELHTPYQGTTNPALSPQRMVLAGVVPTSNGRQLELPGNFVISPGGPKPLLQLPRWALPPAEPAT